MGWPETVDALVLDAIGSYSEADAMPFYLLRGSIAPYVPLELVPGWTDILGAVERLTADGRLVETDTRNYELRPAAQQLERRASDESIRFTTPPQQRF